MPLLFLWEHLILLHLTLKASWNAPWVRFVALERDQVETWAGGKKKKRKDVEHEETDWAHNLPSDCICIPHVKKKKKTCYMQWFPAFLSVHEGYKDVRGSSSGTCWGVCVRDSRRRSRTMKKNNKTWQINRSPLGQQVSLISESSEFLYSIHEAIKSSGCWTVPVSLSPAPKPARLPLLAPEWYVVVAVLCPERPQTNWLFLFFIFFL